MFTLSLAFDTKSNQMLICFDVLLSTKILRNLTCCNIKLKFCFEMLTPDPLHLRCSQTEGGTITIWRSWRGYLQNTNCSVYFTSTFHFVCFIPVGLVCQTHCGLYYFKLRFEATPCLNPQRMNGSCPLLHLGILTPSKM